MVNHHRDSRGYSTITEGITLPNFAILRLITAKSADGAYLITTGTISDHGSYPTELIRTPYDYSSLTAVEIQHSSAKKNHLSKFMLTMFS